MTKPFEDDWSHRFSPFTDEELLGLLDEERGKFSSSNEELMNRYIHELILRRVYPVHWPKPDVHERVRGWGAYWHQYREPLNCPNCNADLRDQKWGPPGKREIGHVDPVRDRVAKWQCPDCKHFWGRKAE